MESPVSTYHGFAVAAILNAAPYGLKCRSAVTVTAVLVIVVVVIAHRVSAIASYQSGIAVVRVPDLIAVKRCHAAEVVAAFSLLVVHALIALPAHANANANAFVLLVHRYTSVIVQNYAVTFSHYASSILLYSSNACFILDKSMILQILKCSNKLFYCQKGSISKLAYELFVLCLRK